MATFTRIKQRPFHGLEHGIKNQENQQQRQRDDDRQPALGALLRFVFARPIDVIAGGQLHLLFTFWMASSTAPPRSRPRTLYLMAT